MSGPALPNRTSGDRDATQPQETAERGITPNATTTENRGEAVKVGDALPEEKIEVSPTFVVSTAIATRDFQDVHHDRDLAVAKGSKDIFINILTTTGLVQRYVTDWAGPEALVRGVAIKLGVPCYAYEVLTMHGQVLERDGAVLVVEVLGRNSLGTHVSGTVRVELPEVAG